MLGYKNLRISTVGICCFVLLSFAGTSATLAQSQSDKVQQLKQKLTAAKTKVQILEKQILELKENKKKKEKKEANKKTTIFDALLKAGLRLALTPSGKNSKIPAKFSFLRTVDEATIYSTDFALIWKMPTPADAKKDSRLHVQASVAANLTSKNSESEDAIKFRLGFVHDIPKIGLFDGIFASYAFKHESDQGFDTRKISVETEFTPTSKTFAMGVDLPGGGDLVDGHAKLPALQINWRPTLGVDAGVTIDKGKSAEDNGALLRMPLKIRANIFLNFLDKSLGINKPETNLRSSFYVENTIIYLPLQNRKKYHNFYTIGLDFPLSKNASIGITFKRGEAAPNFKHIETLGANFGLKF